MAKWVFEQTEARKAKEAELQTITKEVADHLGKPWKYKPAGEHPWSGGIVDGEAKIILASGGGRIIVRGAYPYNGYLGRGQETPTITVAISRGAKVLAKEIRRRFIPRYLPLFDEAVAMRRQHNDRLEKEYATREAIAAEVNSKPAVNGKVFFTGPGRSRGEAEVYGGSVKIELRGIGYEAAILLVKHIVALKSAEKEPS